MRIRGAVARFARLPLYVRLLWFLAALMLINLILRVA